VKIYYTKSQREEPLGSMATLKKILARFVHHKVFYEMSARQRNSRQLYSVKNTFTISHFEIEGNVELLITLFDANNAAHSVEIVNPHALRVYDEIPRRDSPSFSTPTSPAISKCAITCAMKVKMKAHPSEQRWSISHYPNLWSTCTKASVQTLSRWANPSVSSHQLLVILG